MSHLDFGRARRLGKLRILGRVLLTPAPVTFHLNVLDPYLMASLVTRPFPKHVTFVDHGERLAESPPRGMNRVILRAFLKRADEMICVNKTSVALYESLGYSLPRRVRVEHAFIPPPLEDAAKIVAGYDQSTRAFLHGHNPIVVANAAEVVFTRGVDLYGLDMCCDLAGRLLERFPQVGFVFALANHRVNTGYLERVKNRIRQRGAADNFHFLLGGYELWPVFLAADLMVRPTAADGYGISVAEALYCGCPALASDVCERHPGTFLFRNRDADDLFEKATAILSGRRRRSARAPVELSSDDLSRQSTS